MNGLDGANATSAIDVSKIGSTGTFGGAGSGVYEAVPEKI